MSRANIEIWTAVIGTFVISLLLYVYVSVFLCIILIPLGIYSGSKLADRHKKKGWL